MSSEVAIKQQNTNSMASYCFSSAEAFEAAQRMAKALSQATLVPKEYINNIPNCIIALEVAHRLNASPTMVMQNLYIVHGRPSWSSQFIISAVNSCGRFTPLQFHLDGEGDDWGCYVTTKDKDGQILKGPRVNITMAKKEGWYSKNGSKWQTMPEVMLRYRAASFFGRLYAPDVLMGMYTAEEAEDIKDVTPRDNTPLKDAFMAQGMPEAAEPTQEQPNALGELLSPSQAPASIKSEVELTMPGGVLQVYPTEIKLAELMKQINSMHPDDAEAFVNDNRNALGEIVALMRKDKKDNAANQIENMLKG